jgi:hypothetical protein
VSALRYAVLTLDTDWNHQYVQTFDDREEFLAKCRAYAAALRPHITFERRMRNGRHLWQPCETRYLDRR